ncbi:MAG TPA: hypothetical protein VI055_19005 [Rubrobacter sp.]
MINPQHSIDAKTVLLSIVSTRPSASCPDFGKKAARLHMYL